MTFITDVCLQQIVDDILGEFGDVGQTIGAIQAKIGELEVIIAALQQNDARQDQLIRTLRIEVNALKAAVGILQASDAAQNTQIADLYAKSTECRAKNDEQDARLDAIEGNVDQSLYCMVDCDGNPIESKTPLVTCENLENLNNNGYFKTDLFDCNGVAVDETTPLVTCQILEDTLETLPCDILSKDPGQLLVCRPDGIYYGIEAPADVANQFVDYVNGNDANAGTRSSPLRTIRRALERAPVGTINCQVYIMENQTHNWTGDPMVLDATVKITRYGPISDSLSAQWYSVPQSWGYTVCKESKASQPVIMAIGDYTFPALGGYSVAKVKTTKANILTMVGVTIAADYQGRAVTPTRGWQNILNGPGAYIMYDCGVNNGNSTASSPWRVGHGDGAMAITEEFLILQSNNTTNAVLDAGLGLKLTIGGTQAADAPNSGGSGLTWAATTPQATIKASVVGDIAPQPLSPNYNTNI